MGLIGESIDEAAKLTHGMRVYLVSKGNVHYRTYEFTGDVCASNHATGCADGVAVPVATHLIRIEHVKYGNSTGINRDVQRGRKVRGGEIGSNQFMERR